MLTFGTGVADTLPASGAVEFGDCASGVGSGSLTSKAFRAAPFMGMRNTWSSVAFMAAPRGLLASKASVDLQEKFGQLVSIAFWALCRRASNDLLVAQTRNC